MKKALFFLQLLLSFVFIKNSYSQEFTFQDGDRVCFIGNSITMSGRYHNYIQLYYATRFPDRKIKFYNCGISGDVSGGILERMDSDILIHKPTWSVLMIGMNDVNRYLYAKERVSEPGIKEKQQERLNIYFKNVDSVVRILLKANSKVIIQTPSMYDQTAELQSINHFGVNDALGKCTEFLKELAKKYKLPVVDYWTSMNTINSRIQKNNPAATIVGRDRVHPDVQGHFVMANEFLKTQPVPATVSAMSIDAKKRKVKNAIQNTITDIMNDQSGISFSSIETSLPYPLLTKDFNPDSLISFTDNLNKEILQVTSLKKGNYVLKIDSVIIGTYSSSELKESINLAKNIRTPQYQQSEKVLNLLNEYWGIVSKLRQLKYVEYSHLSGVKNKGDMTEVKQVFDSTLAQSKESINFGFFGRVFENYLKNKPQEKELESQLESLHNQIYQVNKPIEHIYKIERLD